MMLICIKDLVKDNEHLFKKGSSYTYEIREDKETMFPHVVTNEFGGKYWFNSVPISNDYIWMYFITIEDYRNSKISELVV